MAKNEISVELLDGRHAASAEIEKTVFELDKEIELLSSQADRIDYFVATAAGIISGILDILWVGELNLARGRSCSSSQVEKFVISISKLLGGRSNDIGGAVKFLESRFPIPADGNTPDFGGGLQHHLRDFAHHPTVAGLIFSLLTQFTGLSYGTDTSGRFIAVPVPEKSKIFIGKNIPDKIFRGTVIWFFHLVSDVAGSSGSAGLSGGTGIPGPVLSMAKEVSSIPFIRDISVNDENLSVFISKIFNGTLFAKRDKAGKLIKGTELKMDFRGELGAVAELGRQALPVIANECVVRTFYFVRRFCALMRQNRVKSLAEMGSINWKSIVPFNNQTVSRMLLVSTGVFTAIDLTEAVITEKYFISVNYVGVGRFTVALGSEVVNYLKLRNVKQIKAMYEEIQRNTYTDADRKIYDKLGDTDRVEKFGLTVEQTEILYNVELLKTLNDIRNTGSLGSGKAAKQLKLEWVKEWKSYMEMGFSSFVNDNSVKLHWYEQDELIKLIASKQPDGTWFRLVLLEAMLFEPYYALSLEKDKKGNDVPSKKYQPLSNPMVGYKKDAGDTFLDTELSYRFCSAGYVARLRKTYNRVVRELNEVLKSTLTGFAVTAVIAVATVATAGMFAPAIAVALVGTQFAGLSGAALTSACLAYLGGGAIAVGGMGMAGGTMAIVGGGALIGIGVGAGAGATVSAVGVMGKKATILQSAKLMVSMYEIFLNDEHDIEYSDYVYEKYVENIAKLEKKAVELKLRENVVPKEEKKKLKAEIKNMDESAHAMKIAMKSMNKFKSSFEEGLGT